MEQYFENKSDGTNKDLTPQKDLKHYLKLTEGWVDKFPKFNVKKVDGFNVIDESETTQVGFKARCGDLLISRVQEKELVYVCPRQGFASLSLAYLADMYGKKLTLFMPSCKRVSDHQLVAMEMGANVEFRRTPAMPTLNIWAKKYADENNAFFIPLGLKHELVTACAVRVVHDYFKNVEHPKDMWSVISTGVLQRALQIALPKTTFHAVAVARSIQKGELGRAKFYSYLQPFSAKSKYIPKEFDSADNYDAKGFDFIRQFGKPGSWFFNVAGNIKPIELKAEDIDSFREWGEIR